MKHGSRHSLHRYLRVVNPNLCYNLKTCRTSGIAT